MESLLTVIEMIQKWEEVPIPNLVEIFVMSDAMAGQFFVTYDGSLGITGKGYFWLF